MDIPELLAIFGPGIAGAVFGAGWWFWVDAVVCSSIAVSFVHYLPGIFASLAALMFNCVRKDDIDYSPYDEGEWRLKLWLFLAYVVSFVSLAVSWVAYTRRIGAFRTINVDRGRWCLAVCICANQWADLLDFTFRVAGYTLKVLKTFV